MKNYRWLYVAPLLFLFSCSTTKRPTVRASMARGTHSQSVSDNSARKHIDSRGATYATRYTESPVVLRQSQPQVEINTGKVKPDELLRYARFQLGVPYAYGSVDRKKGFDCSGFISYVFGHFKIAVPRITYLFTNAGVDIPLEFSKPGDIILFTGSDANSGIVGHMGIVTKNDKGNVEFIHASSSRGVMISDMNSYFVPRYVRVNRIFIPQNPKNG